MSDPLHQENLQQYNAWVDAARKNAEALLDATDRIFEGQTLPVLQASLAMFLGTLLADCWPDDPQKAAADLHLGVSLYLRDRPASAGENT